MRGEDTTQVVDADTGVRLHEARDGMVPRRRAGCGVGRSQVVHTGRVQQDVRRSSAGNFAGWRADDLPRAGDPSGHHETCHAPCTTGEPRLRRASARLVAEGETPVPRREGNCVAGCLDGDRRLRAIQELIRWGEGVGELGVGE